MLRNEVWQCSGVYYYTDRAPSAIGQTQQQRWKNILRKLWSRPEMIVVSDGCRYYQELSVLRSCCAFSNIFQLKLTRPSMRGPRNGRKWTREQKIVRFAWNGRKNQQICVQWIAMDQVKGAKNGRWFVLKAGRSLCRNWATTCFNIGEHSCHKCNLFVCGACLWRSSWEDLITW